MDAQLKKNSDLPTFDVVVAVSESDNAIGAQGKIPWHLPADLLQFARLTRGTRKAVIMGRLTYESLPPRAKPLPGRINVVLTRTGKVIDYPSDVIVCRNLDSALDSLSGLADEIFVIGGEKVYEEALAHPSCNNIHLTRVRLPTPGPTPDADAFFPAINKNVYKFVCSNTCWAPGGEKATPPGIEYAMSLYAKE